MKRDLFTSRGINALIPLPCTNSNKENLWENKQKKSSSPPCSARLTPLSLKVCKRGALGQAASFLRAASPGVTGAALPEGPSQLLLGEEGFGLPADRILAERAAEG